MKSLKINKKNIKEILNYADKINANINRFRNLFDKSAKVAKKTNNRQIDEKKKIKNYYKKRKIEF